jgi:hypothetical protein
LSDGATNGGQTPPPKLAHHWAHDLGINRRFEDWSPEYGWWLEKRIRTMEGFATPTGVVTRRS